MLDEAMAAVAGGEIDDFFLFEEIFCQLFSACEYARDVVRADQWISIGDSIAARLHLPAVSAFCRTHYAGVLTAAGRWTEAATSLSAAIEAWDLSRRSQLRTGALVRLADLRVRQGRLEEAQQLLVTIELSSCGEAARPVAAIHFTRGELGQATSGARSRVDPHRSLANQRRAIAGVARRGQSRRPETRRGVLRRRRAVCHRRLQRQRLRPRRRRSAACPGVQGVGRLRSATTPARHARRVLASTDAVRDRRGATRAGIGARGGQPRRGDRRSPRHARHLPNSGSLTMRGRGTVCAADARGQGGEPPGAPQGN